MWTELVTYISLICHPFCWPLNIGGKGDWTVPLTTSVRLGPLLGTCGALSPRQMMRLFQQTAFLMLAAAFVHSFIYRRCWRLINCRDTYISDVFYRKWLWPIPKSFTKFYFNFFFWKCRRLRSGDRLSAEHRTECCGQQMTGCQQNTEQDAVDNRWQAVSRTQNRVLWTTDDSLSAEHRTGCCWQVFRLTFFIRSSSSLYY